MTTTEPERASPPSEPIGFIGLGMMGSRLAHHLRSDGYPLVVHNRTRERARPLLSEGARWAETPAELGRLQSGGLVLTMLTDGEAVRRVLFGPDGLARSAGAHTLVVDLSTIGPEESREVGRRLGRRGIRYLDAPVLGSTVAAERRELVIVVGGEGTDLARARPVLERLGRRVEHVGPLGAGASFKLVNNLLFLSHVAAAGEALALGEALGLERSRLLALLTDSSASSRALELKKGSIAESRYPAQFKLSLAYKDLVLAMGAARRHGLRLKVGAEVRKWYDLAMHEGRAEEDYASVVESEFGRLKGSRVGSPSPESVPAPRPPPEP